MIEVLQEGGRNSGKTLLLRCQRLEAAADVVADLLGRVLMDEISGPLIKSALKEYRECKK